MNTPAVSPSERRARVVLVDDHELVRSGLRTLIESDPYFDVISEASTADEAVRVVEESQPDLVVMDVRLPGRSGISACHEITARFPDVKVMILTAYADESALASAISGRAAGFVLKNVRASDIVADMHLIMDGESVFDRDIRTVGGNDRFETLSHQERLLATHLAEGLTNREIATRMGLAEKTVKNYVSNILTKLGMGRRSEAAAYVARVLTMSNTTPP